MNVIHVDFVGGVEEFIEYMYLCGLHEPSRGLAEMLGLEQYFSSLVSVYSFNCVEYEYPGLMDDELESVAGLCGIDENKFLRNMVRGLRPNSSVLEIGTFVGGSSIALLQGAEYSDCNVTSIDLFAGFGGHSRATVSSCSSMHWEYLKWQKNISKYASRSRSIHASSLYGLKRLIKEGCEYDLIFLDASHEMDTFAEMALISVLLKEGGIVILDDVLDYNTFMTDAWAASMKHFFGDPSFYNGRFVVARGKDSAIPPNVKGMTHGLFDLSRKLVDNLRDLTSGCPSKVYVDESCSSGFNIVIE